MKVQYDVAVFGAGLAGVAATVNAFKAGKKVILVEQSFTVGGNATVGLVNPFMRYWLDDKVLSGEFFNEILRELDEVGGLYKNTFDSELLKIVLFRKLTGVELLFRAIPIKVNVSGNRINSVEVQTSLGNRIEIEASLYIDATGDGSLSYMAGCSFESGDEKGDNQAVTLMFTIANVNFEEVRKSIRRNPENFFSWVSPDAEVLSVAGYFEEVKSAKKDGIDYPNEFFFFNQLPTGNRVTVNTTHLHVKTIDDFQLSAAMAKLHEQVFNVYKFAKQYVSGFEDSYIEKIAPLLGIRESRRIEGKYKFKGTDVVEKRKFKNAVVRACYGIDVHKRETTISQEERKVVPKYEDYYEIPLESLISKDFENLAVVGRCFSSDFLGQSAARIMPTCTDMGDAIGKMITKCQKSFYEILP